VEAVVECWSIPGTLGTSLDVVTPTSGAWPLSDLVLGLDGTAAVSVAVGETAAQAAGQAGPVQRTVSSAGVSYGLCVDGLAAVAVRQPGQPLDWIAPTALAPVDGTVRFNDVDGLWADASPEAASTVWFAAIGEDGGLGPWTSDDVVLTPNGMVRIDVRLGDPLAACADVLGTSWLLGDLVSDSDGATPATSPDTGLAGEDGCGCHVGAAPRLGVTWLGLLLWVRRRRALPA
jgi:hypothetical protein